jgi:hypothetical protein
MQYFITKTKTNLLYLGLFFVVLVALTEFLTNKVIFGTIALLLVPFALFTGTVELNVTNNEIVVIRGLLKIKHLIKIENIKAFHFTYIFTGVAKIVTKDNKSIPITFGRFENWGFVIIDVYNAIKNVEGIIIDEKIQEIVVNANK